MVEETINTTYNVEVFCLPPDFTYNDYLMLSERAREGYLVDRGHNTVVNGGKDQIAGLLAGTTTGTIAYCGVGSSSTGETSSQTDLQSPIARVAVSNKYIISTGSAHTDTFFSTSQAAGTWLETGLFVLSSGGIMFCRKVISSFVKSASNTAVVAWTVTFS